MEDEGAGCGYRRVDLMRKEKMYMVGKRGNSVQLSVCPVGCLYERRRFLSGWTQCPYRLSDFEAATKTGQTVYSNQSLFLDLRTYVCMYQRAKEHKFGDRPGRHC